MDALEFSERHASVLVDTGLKVEPGDRLVIWAEGEVHDLARAVARQAYAIGADDVDVVTTDFELAHARASSGRTDVANNVSPSMARMVEAVAQGASFLWIASVPPAVTDDAIGELMSQQLAAIRAAYAPMRASMLSGAVCWCITVSPTAAWAARLYPDTDADTALRQLRDALGRTLRLDSDDPVATWAAHTADLEQRAAELTARAYAALRYRGPGTDLTVGLIDQHEWVGGGAVRRGCTPNLPTEEVFTAPHMHRVDGHVRFTKPALLQGTLVDGIELEFRAGEIVAARAGSGEGALHEFLESDPGARRAGEVALVPQSSRVAAENLVWLHPLLDENDASHIALGAGIPKCLPAELRGDPARRDAVGLNASRVHHDFVVGSNELDVHGVTASGAEEPLLLGGEWA